MGDFAGEPYMNKWVEDSGGLKILDVILRPLRQLKGIVPSHPSHFQGVHLTVMSTNFRLRRCVRKAAVMVLYAPMS